MLPKKNDLVFQDDLDRESLRQALKTQLNFVKKQDQSQTLFLQKKEIPYSWLTHSLEDFLTFLDTTPTASRLNEYIHENYDIYQAGGQKQAGNRTMLVTGYYEPLFKGSTKKSKAYKYPIYKRPNGLITRKIKTKDVTGRYNDLQKFVPFWTRAEIENFNLLKGDELVYLADPFDAFLLHIQGSGKLIYDDGSVVSVRYAASNGQEYKSIGKYLVDQGKMTLAEITVPRLREYTSSHPEEIQEIFQYNPRFIFFSWGDSREPIGSMGEELTPGRSVAIDNKVLPGPTIGYLQTRKPVINKEGEITHWQKFSRFVLPQDSGSAIKGSGRIDLFWGHGSYAEIAASNMKEEGKLYFLVKKGFGRK